MPTSSVFSTVTTVWCLCSVSTKFKVRIGRESSRKDSSQEYRMGTDQGAEKDNMQQREQKEQLPVPTSSVFSTVTTV